MRPDLRKAIDQEIQHANALEAAGDLQQAFAHLERAHILGQRYFLTHLHAHLRMFSIARRQRDVREIRGQAMRLAAVVPGYVFGWVPKGNTGGANVSALKPMPIPPDLAPLLSDFSVWRDVVLRLVIALVAACTYFAGLEYFGGQSVDSGEARQPPISPTARDLQ